MWHEVELWGPVEDLAELGLGPGLGDTVVWPFVALTAAGEKKRKKREGHVTHADTAVELLHLSLHLSHTHTHTAKMGTVSELCASSFQAFLCPSVRPAGTTGECIHPGPCPFLPANRIVTFLPQSLYNLLVDITRHSSNI